MCFGPTDRAFMYRTLGGRRPAMVLYLPASSISFWIREIGVSSIGRIVSPQPGQSIVRARRSVL